MECMLLPRDPTASLSRVPYVADQRYDGGEWFAYTKRRYPTRPPMIPEEPLTMHQHLMNMPIVELESYLQTWLFFGLLSEFFGGNALTAEAFTFADANQSMDKAGSGKVLASIYKDFLNQDGKGVYVTTKMLLQKMEDEVNRTLPDRQAFIDRCMKLGKCLETTWKVLQVPPNGFDPRIRTSIAIVGELLSDSMNIVFSKFKIDQRCAAKWPTPFFRQDPVRHLDIKGPREIMLANGWCPSDISRSISKFKSIQMLHFLSMMSRAHPTRDHKHCSDVECIVYQIKQGYQLSHATSGCSCLPLAVDNSVIISILEEEDTIPLLKFVGDMDNIRIELVPSSKDTPYVAISHVWADGLGNQTANSLNRCQLIRLRNLAQAIEYEESSRSDLNPLIWIDTLCCPIGSTEAKQMALEKIRNVYQHARHVLVLDAGIQAYETRGMEVAEQLARIFTSGWVRRLWTIQEGALAKSLYFQFSDRAASLEALRERMEQLSSDLRHSILMSDFREEYLRIQAFFHAHRLGRLGPDLNLLTSALLYRSVSVASDEPVCIGTLMSLDIKQIVAKDVPEDERMRIVWKLLAEKQGGLPAKIIFLPDKKIERAGWRWAPASLLPITRQLLSPDTRSIQWLDDQLGQPTAHGLYVRFPGFRLALACINDNRPHQPWRGLEQLDDDILYFCDTHTGEWYMFFDEASALMASSYNDDGRAIQNTYDGFSLKNLVLSEDCYVIEEEARKGSIGSGLVATLSPPNDATQTTELLDGLPVQVRRRIVFSPASQAQSTIYNTIKALAHRLRNDSLTDKLLDIDNVESEEYITHLKALKQKAKDMMADAMIQNPALGGAVDVFWGSDLRDKIWVLIGDWYHHDFVGTRLPEGQMFYVD